jgi:hypothetical protein
MRADGHQVDACDKIQTTQNLDTKIFREKRKMIFTYWEADVMIAGAFHFGSQARAINSQNLNIATTPFMSAFLLSMLNDYAQYCSILDLMNEFNFMFISAPNLPHYVHCNNSIHCEGFSVLSTLLCDSI